jgi:exodeoxyribonuclease VII small subunit
MGKSSSKSATAADEAPASYEAALEELERLIASMESGQGRLDDLIGHYKRGAELLAYCRGRLEAVEGQVKVLEGDGLKAWNPPT